MASLLKRNRRNGEEIGKMKKNMRTWNYEYVMKGGPIVIAAICATA